MGYSAARSLERMALRGDGQGRSEVTGRGAQQGGAVHPDDGIAEPGPDELQVGPGEPATVRPADPAGGQRLTHAIPSRRLTALVHPCLYAGHHLGSKRITPDSSRDWDPASV